MILKNKGEGLLLNYDQFSACYDSFTDDVDYSLRSKRILEIFEKYDKKPTLLLDLACGTGNFSFELAKENIQVIGVDCSEGMLSIAMNKLDLGQSNPMFLNQRAEDLDLYGTVDGAICMLDSLNHITDYEDFSKAIEKVSLFLEKDRLFVFDLNTEYKHREILSSNTFVKENDNGFCVWQNECADDGSVDIYLDFFLLQSDGRYERYMENFSEVLYSQKQVEAILEKARLKIVALFDDISHLPPNDKTERITYVVRKI